MWHITFAGVPDFSHARIARLSGSVPCLAMTHAYFRAEHEIGILADRFGASINLREVDVVEFGNRERGEADIGDMNECVKARASLGHYVAAEGRKIVRAGIAAEPQVVVHWWVTSSSAGIPMAEP
jgi:hypothetical protein